MKKFCLRILLVGAACGSLVLAVHGGLAAEKEDKPAVASGKTASAPATQKYTLRYKFHQDEEVRTKVRNLATIETTIGGVTQTTDMESISTKLWRFTAVDAAGNMVFEHVVEAVDLRNQMSGRQEVRYNSATDKTAPPGYASVAQTLGKPLTVVTIDPQGTVLKREQPQPTNFANLDNTGSVLIVPMPKEPIPLGHVWTLPVEVNLPLKDGSHKAIQTRQRYELQKVDGRIATIAVETQILTPVSNPEIRAQLIQRMWQGTMDFDIDAGRMIGQRTDLDERVLGFSGPESSMHYVARVTEELLPAVTKTASK